MLYTLLLDAYLLLRCKVGTIELSFFSSLDATQRNEILEKVLAYGTKLE